MHLCLYLFNEDNDETFQMMTKASLLVLCLCFFLTIGFPTQVFIDDPDEEDDDDLDDPNDDDLMMMIMSVNLQTDDDEEEDLN